jgi:hypothetical protein
MLVGNGISKMVLKTTNNISVTEVAVLSEVVHLKSGIRRMSIIRILETINPK